MNSDPGDSSFGTKVVQNTLGVPVAIVLAGGLIALALYFGAATGSKSGSTDTTGVAGAPQAAPAQPPAPTIGDIRPVTDADHVRGAATPKVTIIEYSDLECPFCKTFHPTLEQLVTEYPNDVRWVYRHFPLEQLHSKAPQEAIATECAGEQGKFWELTDYIFETTPANNGLDLTKLPDMAEAVGVPNIAQFETCLASDKYAQRVAEDIADAQVAGGQGTPYSVILGPGGEKVPINGAQPYSAVKAAVDSLL